MKSYGSPGGGYEWYHDEDRFYNDGDDDDEKQGIEVDDLGIDVEGLISQKVVQARLHRSQLKMTMTTTTTMATISVFLLLAPHL